MDKIKPHITVPADSDGMRLDRFLRSHFPHLQQSLLEKMLRKGEIRLQGEKVKGATRLQEGHVLTYPGFLDKLTPTEDQEKLIPPLTVAEREMLKEMVFFEDDHLLIVNKPQGLATQGGTGIKRSVDQLMALQHSDNPPRLVHRLDKDTSGVLILAKSRSVAQSLTEAFRKRSPQKTYLAVVVGRPLSDDGVIKAPLTKTMVGQGEKVLVDENVGLPAETRYKVLKDLGEGLTLLELSPKTGRTHQLRVHTASVLKTPILGDGKYGGKKATTCPHRQKKVGLHLHAARITFLHPVTGESLTFEAPVPEHMEGLGVKI